MGEVPIESMRSRPDPELLVPCGHTPGAGVVEVPPTLELRTGGAAHGRLMIRMLLITA